MLLPCAAALAEPHARRGRIPIHVAERGQLVHLINGKTPRAKSIMSLRRSPERTVVPSVRSAASPAACPWVSLNFLKPSTSSIAIAKG